MRFFVNAILIAMASTSVMDVLVSAVPIGGTHLEPSNAAPQPIRTQRSSVTAVKARGRLSRRSPQGVDTGAKFTKTGIYTLHPVNPDNGLPTDKSRF